MSLSVRDRSSAPEGVVSEDSFEAISVIGKGSYAKVLLVRAKASGTLFALKAIKKYAVTGGRQMAHVFTERKVLLAMRDLPFFVKVHHMFQSSSKAFFVLDYCPGGELFGLLQKQRQLEEGHARFYAAQLVLALEAMHARNIVYRDLKPENVLLDAQGHVRLVDFGLSRLNTCNSGARTICGTPEYLAPEILRSQSYGRAVDWWSLGCLIYELLVGIPPFYVSNRSDLFRKIVAEPVTYPTLVSAAARRLLERLLDKRPESRMGTADVAEVKAHPFFAGIDWEALRAGRVEAPFIPEMGSNCGVNNFEETFTGIPRESLDEQDSDSGMEYDNFSWSSEDL